MKRCLVEHDAVFLPEDSADGVALLPSVPTSRPAAGQILVMDDDAGLRGAAGAILTAKGYEHEIVKDGVEAVLAFQRARDQGRPFAIVILDLTVPGGMGGVETLRHLRLTDPGVRAIASSGYWEDPVMTAPRVHGFSAILPKPFTAKEVDDAVRRLLASAESE